MYMKNAIILHGTSCRPDSFWQPSIKKFLEKRGYEVWVPALPNPDTPDLKLQLPFVLQHGKFNEDTIMIGHSAGGPLILSILEKINTKIRKVVLVAGYARPKGKERQPELILQDKYDWKKISSNVEEIVFINSDNDPWGCDHKEGMYMFEHLGGTLIIRHGEGHMGSDSFNQPYKEFPLLEKLLEL
jgi:predicted alpha/beta hydrolase family esterase